MWILVCFSGIANKNENQAKYQQHSTKTSKSYFLKFWTFLKIVSLHKWAQGVDFLNVII